MWFWLTLGWATMALVTAVVHHRWRQATRQPSPEVAAFVLRLENELVAAHPGVRFLGMVPQRFACVLRVDGQETMVSLHDAFRLAEAEPDRFTRMVAGLLEDIREVGLDRVGDHDFSAAAPHLLPQVRARAWLDEKGTFGDSGLVHGTFAEGLVTVYVIDDASTMVFVCREHLRRWRKTQADLHNLALTNLARRGGSLPQAPLPAPVIVQTGDGYDAARALLLEPRDGLLVAIPDRDTLWVGPDSGQNLEQLMATTAAIAEEATHPVSGQVYRVTAGQLEALPGRR
jgi:hypothetical protein